MFFQKQLIIVGLFRLLIEMHLIGANILKAITVESGDKYSFGAHDYGNSDQKHGNVATIGCNDAILDIKNIFLTIKMDDPFVIPFRIIADEFLIKIARKKQLRGGFNPLNIIDEPFF